MKNSLVFLFTLTVSFLNGQTIGKRIILTQVPTTVPYGKVWKLERDKQTIAQVNKGTLVQGTQCSALFFSNPNIAFSVNGNGISYGIILNNLAKVPYTNSVTYSFTPISFITTDFDLQSLVNRMPEEVGTKEIIFKAGETVFVGSCFTTIELTEYDMSKADLEAEKKKLDAIQQEKSKLKSNFNIPISREKGLKDSLLNLIVFSSNSVGHKQVGKGFALDKTSAWTMSLTIDSFTISSSNGISKSYKVLDIKYNDTFKMQEFRLGDFRGNYTHNLYVSWSNSTQQYSALLVATDYSEEYQFQQVQATNRR